MMTRKDYITTANILREAMTDAEQYNGPNSREAFIAIESIVFIAEKFAEYFAEDNPRFSEERFFAEISKDREKFFEEIFSVSD